MVCLIFFFQEGTFGRHFVIFGIFLDAFFFFTRWEIFFVLHCSVLVALWGSETIPVPGSKGGGGRGEKGGAGVDLLYRFLFSVSKVTAN